MDKFYVTTPIYYVNDVPHVGHAYSTIAADVLARYWREKIGAENVFFLTGTDEHGAKVARAAEEVGKNPQEFADSIVPHFENAWKLLDISNNYFIRTTNPQHGEIVQEVLQKIYDNGHIDSRIYEGLYCEGCEKFLTEDDLVDGLCPLHLNKKPVHQKEKNYFFKLSAFENQLKEIFNNDKVKIMPPNRKHEIISRLELGLQDISISREGVSWGIPVPWDKKQTVYVWIEALLNYYTATQFLPDKKRFWPADVHIIGKDILWFHTVIWCALLLAAKIPLPKAVFAHGFFTINGQKMSKSLGNVISPKELVDTFGADAARYLLLSEFPFGEDGDFSFEKLKVRYNADLANGLGNLVARIAKVAEQSGLEFPGTDEDHKADDYHRAIERLDLYNALGIAIHYVRDHNQYIDQKEPWTLLIKEKRTEELKEILEYLVRGLRATTKLIKPFLPQTAEKIEKQFAGPTIKSAEPLFPRLA